MGEAHGGRRVRGREKEEGKTFVFFFFVIGIAFVGV
jgi:hypothetical protein